MYKNNRRDCSKFKVCTRFNSHVICQESTTQSATILILTVGGHCKRRHHQGKSKTKNEN
jgi:hypothetical protein